MTTPGQTVGKRLDKSGLGNHATAPTDTARLIYGVDPRTGRRNKLNRSRIFGSGTWFPVDLSIADETVTAPDGTMSASAMTITGVNSQIFQTCTVGADPVTAAIWLKGVGASIGKEVRFWIWFAGTATGAGAFAYLTLTADWQRVPVTADPTTAGTLQVRLDPGYGGATSGDTIHVWNAQLEDGTVATADQIVTSDYDVTEAGVATCHYVQYDGVDDSMSTAAIDFTATDKMSVFAGVRKLSDAAIGLIAEPSAGGGFGKFGMYVNGGSGNTGYGYFSLGTKFGTVNVNSGYAAPNASVLTGLSDIVGDLTKLRINGAQVGQTTQDLGTGNFGNYPLYFGRRGDATLPFYGRDYGIIVVGKATSAAEIASTEAYLAAKTSGVTL